MPVERRVDNANARADEQPLAPETPEDVAILYSWANLPGAKYRDFSASRREYRAQQRARAAESLRQTELKAAQELEEAAQREVAQAQKQVEATRQAEARAAADAEAKRHAEEILRRAEERAEQERQEVLRRQQSAEELRVMAERAQKEMMEARRRAEEQAARYAEAEQSKPQTSTQGRVLPGETSDPYYYTGPVDPAYFASTPGVRTARPARVSTERKAYVYPMHPGSEEFDSGTVVAYRGAPQFAPSPLQSLTERQPPMQEIVGGHAQAGPGAAAQAPAGRAAPGRGSAEHGPTGQVLGGLSTGSSESARPLAESGSAAPRDGDHDAEYDLDDDYYDGDHATRVFSPSPRTKFDGERAAGDLHIRPASRVSDVRDRQARAVRPSPLSQTSPMPQAPRVSRAPVAERHIPEGSGAVQGAGEVAADRRASNRAVSPTDGGARRESPLQETAINPAIEGAEPFFSAVHENGRREAGKLTSIRFEEQPSQEDGSSSRMFIPSPRRRVLQAEDEPAAEPAAEEIRNREAAAAEGQRRSQAEAESRTALDRYVEDQTEKDPDSQKSLTTDVSSDMLADAMLESGEMVAHREEPVQWRSVNRAGETGFRRRRQPGREPVARTARQPRSLQDGEGGDRSGEQAAPPAWLSGERANSQSGEMAKIEGGAGPGVPAAPGDPGVPGPRPVLRRQPSSLRARAQSSNPASRPVGSTSDPGLPVAGGRPDQEARRSEDHSQAGTSLGTSADTLQQSRERVASRWFALSGLMGSDRQSGDSRVGQRSAPRPAAPMLSVLSISGGVGKTSIVATLGRALSSMGEKVMLADTNVHGILPYYFGAREQRPGAVRTFSPPPGSSDAPVVLVSYDADGRAYDDAGQTRVLEDLYRRSSEVQRVLVDAGVNSAWLARTVSATNPWVLVPVAPDMNSVLGTQAVERLFQDVTGADGMPVKPYYVLNQYDPSMPLHLDVREVLRQFLGDRLLPIMLQRTPVVSEALAEGMTVIDYAPRTPIATDYMNLAAWVRKLADPGQSYARPARWSER